jgi:anthranilate synthase component 2
VSPLLLLDNKDSFVWNLAQAFQTLGQEVSVLRSEQIDIDTLDRNPPSALIVSPGPGRPETAGQSVALVQRLSGQIPILGVCLGHQAIATAFGGDIQRVDPCHGKPWPIQHNETGLFRGLPNPLQACRYHSLAVVRSSLPDILQVSATSPEGVVMAIHHRTHPTFGVQFHPESFRTPLGLGLLKNFLEAAKP